MKLYLSNKSNLNSNLSLSLLVYNKVCLITVVAQQIQVILDLDYDKTSWKEYFILYDKSWV